MQSRLQQRNTERDIEIQEEINNPDTSEQRRQQLNNLMTFLRAIDRGHIMYSGQATNRPPAIQEELITQNSVVNQIITPSLEEDSDDYTSIRPSTDSMSDEYIDNSESDTSCSNGTEEAPLTKERDWMKKNCSVCKSMVTLDKFTDEDYHDIVSVKVYDIENEKFGKGHCISKPDMEGMLRSDIGSDYPKYIYSLYKKREDAVSERTIAGHGSAPSNQFVVQLNIDDLSIYVTLGSIHRLLHASEKIYYAAPLYGGKRRRLGNIPGSMTVVGANHGQIPGFRIYKLFTADEIRAGVEVSIGENDFIMPMTISKKVEDLVSVFSDTSRIRQIVMDEIIEHLLKPNPQ
jgi:hypothetical protein